MWGSKGCENERLSTVPLPLPSPWSNFRWFPFAIRWPSARHPFAIRWPSVRHPLAIRSPSVGHPFGIRSGFPVYRFLDVFGDSYTLHRSRCDRAILMPPTDPLIFDECYAFSAIEMRPSDFDATHRPSFLTTVTHFTDRSLPACLACLACLPACLPAWLA